MIRCRSVGALGPWCFMKKNIVIFADGTGQYSLFEHGAIGRHEPSGFADLTSVAP